MSDPRITLARPDLAAADLQGLIRAAAYAPTHAHHCVVPSAALRSSPDPAAEQLDQLLFGEIFDVLEVKAGWAWGQARRDGYVGFVASHALAQGAPAATHRISALRAYGFSAPDIKSPPVGLYSLNALVRVGAQEGRFMHAEGAGWFASNQLSAIGAFEADPASVAETFLGAPYLWGGRDSLGLDCSGLVQQALYACGRACPRDSDQQAKLGVPVAREALARGDLVFWRGHVGMMLDPTRMIHANAFHMKVAIEPLQDTLGRIGEAMAYRRP
jgi:hypothetical protein